MALGHSGLFIIRSIYSNDRRTAVASTWYGTYGPGFALMINPPRLLIVATRPPRAVLGYASSGKLVNI